MGMTWTDLTEEELCDLMCGAPEEPLDLNAYAMDRYGIGVDDLIDDDYDRLYNEWSDYKKRMEVDYGQYR